MCSVVGASMGPRSGRNLGPDPVDRIVLTTITTLKLVDGALGFTTPVEHCRRWAGKNVT